MKIDKLNFINMDLAVLENSHKRSVKKTTELLTFNNKGMCQIFATSWRVSMFDSCRYKSLF